MLSNIQVPEDLQFETLQTQWCADCAAPCPEDTLAHKQSCWDKPIIDIKANNLSNLVTDDYHRARLKAVAAPHASDWLFALPITSCGLRLEDEALRVAVGLRLGFNICEPHECRCGVQVKADGSHGLSCSLGPGRAARHASLNELIYRSLVRAGFPAVKEPEGLSRADGKGPDGLYLISWRMGRALIWDATLTNLLTLWPHPTCHPHRQQQPARPN
jgi:hypothetical protein